MRKHIRVVSAAIIRDGRYLITQRMPKAVLPNLWEFPGGKVEPGEDDADALVRELRYRVGTDIAVKELISRVERSYDDYVVDLSLYRCELVGPEPRPETVQQLAWVTSEEFAGYAFTPADERSMAALLFGGEEEPVEEASGGNGQGGDDGDA